MTQHQSVAIPTEWVVAKESQAAKLPGRAQGLIWLPSLRVYNGFPGRVGQNAIGETRLRSSATTLHPAMALVRE